MLLLEFLVLGLFSFAIGGVVGATNASTVSQAIATLRQAENKAQSTLAQITAHKNS